MKIYELFLGISTKNSKFTPLVSISFQRKAEMADRRAKKWELENEIWKWLLGISKNDLLRIQSGLILTKLS